MASRHGSSALSGAVPIMSFGMSTGAGQLPRKCSDKENDRIAHDNALGRVIIDLLKADTELVKQYRDNGSFRRWLAGSILATSAAPPCREHYGFHAARIGPIAGGPRVTSIRV